MERRQYVIGTPTILNETKKKWEHFCGNDAQYCIGLMNPMTLSVMSVQVC